MNKNMVKDFINNLGESDGGWYSLDDLYLGYYDIFKKNPLSNNNGDLYTVVKNISILRKCSDGKYSDIISGIDGIDENSIKDLKEINNKGHYSQDKILSAYKFLEIKYNLRMYYSEHCNQKDNWPSFRYIGKASNFKKTYGSTTVRSHNDEIAKEFSKLIKPTDEGELSLNRLSLGTYDVQDSYLYCSSCGDGFMYYTIYGTSILYRHYDGTYEDIITGIKDIKEKYIKGLYTIDSDKRIKYEDILSAFKKIEEKYDLKLYYNESGNDDEVRKIHYNGKPSEYKNKQEEKQNIRRESEPTKKLSLFQRIFNR